MAFKHYRDRDHTGTQDDTTVVLSTAIGQYPAGTTLAVVLASLDARIIALNSTNRIVNAFVADAFVAPVFRADAVLFKAGAGSLTADAWFAYGDSVTLDAIIEAPSSATFTADASIV